MIDIDGSVYEICYSMKKKKIKNKTNFFDMKLGLVYRNHEK